jgi:hypothetical protein
MCISQQLIRVCGLEFGEILCQKFRIVLRAYLQSLIIVLILK